VCVCVCVCVWRSGDGLKGEEVGGKECQGKAALLAQECPAGLGDWKAGDVFINVKGRQWQVAAVATDVG